MIGRRVQHAVPLLATRALRQGCDELSFGVQWEALGHASAHCHRHHVDRSME